MPIYRVDGVEYNDHILSPPGWLYLGAPAQKCLELQRAQNHGPYTLHLGIKPVFAGYFRGAGDTSPRGILAILMLRVRDVFVIIIPPRRERVVSLPMAGNAAHADATLDYAQELGPILTR